MELFHSIRRSFLSIIVLGTGAPICQPEPEWLGSGMRVSRLFPLIPVLPPLLGYSWRFQTAWDLAWRVAPGGWHPPKSGDPPPACMNENALCLYNKHLRCKPISPVCLLSSTSGNGIQIQYSYKWIDLLTPLQWMGKPNEWEMNINKYLTIVLSVLCNLQKHLWIPSVQNKNFVRAPRFKLYLQRPVPSEAGSLLLPHLWLRIAILTISSNSGFLSTTTAPLRLPSSSRQKIWYLEVLCG